MKYQANVLSWEEQQEAEVRHKLGESEAGPSRHIPGGFLIVNKTDVVERGHDRGERKHESTLDILSIPSDDRECIQLRAADESRQIHERCLQPEPACPALRRDQTRQCNQELYDEW